MVTSRTRYILAGYCIDGTGAPARKDVMLTVQEGIITAISGRTDLSQQRGADIDDLSHCTLVPPLVDCNLALARSPSINLRQAVASDGLSLSEQIVLMQRHIRYLHDHGVLGAVDNDSDADLIGRLREMETGNALISLRSPWDSNALFTWRQISSGITSNDQALSGVVIGRRRPQENRQKRDKKLVMLANGPDKVTQALDEGCDAVVQGFGMGEKNLQRMAAEQILWIPSLFLAKNGQATPGVEDHWRKVLADQLEQLRLARNLGITAATGTGAGNTGIIHGESMVEEIKLFIKAGYPLEEAIRSASEVGARFFGMEQIGAFQIGRPATFLVTRGSPHQLPRKLAYLENIYLNGFPSSAYRKNPVKVVHYRPIQ